MAIEKEAIGRNKILTSGIWYTFSAFLVKGMVVITTPVFTRILTKEDFGACSNFYSWCQLLSILFFLNVSASVINAKYDFNDDLNRYCISIYSLGATITIAFAVLANKYYQELEPILSFDLSYFDIICAYILANGAFQIFQAKEQTSFRYKSSVLLSVMLAVLSSVLSVFFVLKFEDKFNARIWGSVIPTFVLGVIILFKLALDGKRIRFSYWKYALPICLPYIPHTLSMTVLSSMDRAMITNICGSRDTALYSVAATCGSAISVINSSMNTTYAPWLAKCISEEKYGTIKKYSYSYVLLFIYMSFGMVLLTPELLLILGGMDYIQAKHAMPPIILGGICLFIYTMFVNVEQIKKKTVGMAVASCFCAGLNYVLNAVFIPRCGYVAASYTTCFSYFCLLLAHMYMVKKLDGKLIYNYKFILTMVFLSSLLVGFVSVLFNHNMLRWIVFGVYVIVSLIIVCFKWEKITAFMIGKH